MTVETQLFTTLIADDEPLEEIPAEILVYGERLNRPGPLEFSLAVDHPLCRREILNPGRHEIGVRRNREIVWKGPLLTFDEPEKPDDGPWTMTFGGEGLAHYLGRWYTTSRLTFNQVDQFTVGRQLVNHHQTKAGGDFGIDTTDTSLSGVLRDRTYEREKNIGEAVEQLAAVENGFDFHVNPATRKLVFHYPRRGSRKPDLVWDERNIRSFSRRGDSGEQASQMLGVGAGEGEDALRRSAQSSGAVSNFRLTQRVYTNTDVNRAATLLSHVQRELAKFANPAEVLAVTVGTVEPPVFSYQVGDEGRIVWPSTYDPVARFMRLVGRDLVWESGEERAVLYLVDV